MWHILIDYFKYQKSIIIVKYFIFVKIVTIIYLNNII